MKLEFSSMEELKDFIIFFFPEVKEELIAKEIKELKDGSSTLDKAVKTNEDNNGPKNS